jgi:hypothetical protein
MAGDKIQIGPFIGGLNTQADPSAVADNDLVVCDNFEPDLDGSLKSRAPIVSNNSDMPLQSSGDLRLLGYFVNTDNTPYLIGTDGVSKTYALIGGTWTLITSTFAASAMAQFDGKAWLLAPVGSTNPGGYWTPVSSFVPQPNMPKGDVIVAHKLRLWVAPGGNAQTNGTRLYNSDVIGTSPLWPVSPDFTDIGGGDGQNIINAVVLFDSLLIFRTRSIFTFVFGTDPATAQVRVVQNNVGLTHKDALTMFENNIFFLYDSKAYIFQNSRAQQINQKVEFESGPTAGITQPFAVSIFNRRVIFSFWSNTYVFYIQNQTWTTWSSQAWGPIGRVLSVPPTSGPVIAYTHSSRTAAGGSSPVGHHPQDHRRHYPRCREFHLHPPDQELQLPGLRCPEAPVLRRHRRDLPGQDHSRRRADHLREEAHVGADPQQRPDVGLPPHLSEDLGCSVERPDHGHGGH